MSTPIPIAARLRTAGWHPVGDDDWQRPGTYADVHSWPVADLIWRTDEPRHALPSMPAAIRPRQPGFRIRASQRPARPMLVAPYAPRSVGQPRKVDLIRRVAAMHDEQGMTFAAISAQIGGKPNRAYYLYTQADKVRRIC